MTATNHTEHYELSQYTGNDHPTYTGDYNSDMSKIDAAIYAASQSGGSGMAAVEHTADLTGDGSTDNPLGVADTIARTEDIPSLDGYATTESVTQAIAAAIADRLTAGDIKPGNGINIETSGNQVTIGYVGGGGAGGLTAVAHDETLTGDGTGGTPLRLAAGTMMTQNSTIDDDFNKNLLKGVYSVEGGRYYINAPNGMHNIRGTLFVFKRRTSSILGQVLIENYAEYRNCNYIFSRYSADGGAQWSQWERIALLSDIPDVSALTSRIAALESQVAALTAAATPSDTGLTAEQLDSLYSDGYNIIRVGTPTPTIESEVNPNVHHTAHRPLQSAHVR